MKILIVEPGKAPRRADIPHALGAMQHVVGGYIEAVYPWEDPVALVCNEEGLVNGLELNRHVERGITIAGTFFIVGLSEEDFTDLSDELAAKYEELLKEPQVFMRIGRHIYAISDTCMTRVD